MDVGPLSRDDGQTADDALDEMETGQDAPMDDPDSPVDAPND